MHLHVNFHRTSAKSQYKINHVYLIKLCKRIPEYNCTILRYSSIEIKENPRDRSQIT